MKKFLNLEIENDMILLFCEGEKGTYIAHKFDPSPLYIYEDGTLYDNAFPSSFLLNARECEHFSTFHNAVADMVSEYLEKHDIEVVPPPDFEKNCPSCETKKHLYLLDKFTNAVVKLLNFYPAS